MSADVYLFCTVGHVGLKKAKMANQKNRTTMNEWDILQTKPEGCRVKAHGPFNGHVFEE